MTKKQNQAPGRGLEADTQGEADTAKACRQASQSGKPPRQPVSQHQRFGCVEASLMIKD
ncbi:hypothetical protein [Bradyrhizobium sp. JYMT SZCCT0428]|uniref:hypothetical protein n=1 Tax=Bradyrhizobium sp. JYMT SZCCT0428 TaxID=2807673 RepID=UPI001BA8B5C9|nr:hypothetical protein [Bradyrhizobium sp. JYMT SZCCT0428]MBR1151099.1 hypothetical protein [Bradyrhizobium sp. JYMT SZCCT0428]